MDDQWIISGRHRDWGSGNSIEVEVLEESVPLWRRLPAALAPVQQAIEASQSILELEPGWDGDEAEGYEEATWGLAAEFLAEHAVRLWEYSKIRIAPPHIDAAGRGSIDLHWKTSRFELLINVRRDGTAALYGDNYRGFVIKGPLDPQDISPGLIAWFAQTS
jgi:hypothetical protein